MPSTCTPICGNSGGEFYIVGDEDCNDGNTASGDGCSSVCQVEAGYTCDTTGNPTSFSTCSSICGDGLIVGSEQCDDANRANGDGCTYSGC